MPGTHPGQADEMPDLGPDIQPKTWPIVIGIISIVLAALGVCGGGCGALNIAMFDKFTGMAAEKMGPPPDIMRPPMWQLGLIGVSLIFNILLLVAGILSVRRNPASRTLYLVYAVFGILTGLIGSYVAIKQQLDIRAWAASDPSNPWAQQAGSPVGLIITCVFVLIGLSWPVFLLIWFGAFKRTPESFGPRPTPTPI